MRTPKKYEGSWQDVGLFYARPTGTWRERIPVVNHSKCSQCGWCFICCPTGSMSEKSDRLEVDLSYCKGCGICAKECPVTAIVMLRVR